MKRQERAAAAIDPSGFNWITERAKEEGMAMNKKEREKAEALRKELNKSVRRFPVLVTLYDKALLNDTSQTLMNQVLGGPFSSLDVGAPSRAAKYHPGPGPYRLSAHARGQ